MHSMSAWGLLTLGASLCVLSPALLLDPGKTGEVCGKSAGTDNCRTHYPLLSKSRPLASISWADLMEYVDGG